MSKEADNVNSTLSPDAYGELEAKDNRWRLRFTRPLAHAPETVWRAISEPGHLEAWFPQRIVGEWSVGAPLRFESRHGEFPPFDGEVLAYQPGSLIEFRWGTDVIRLEVVPTDAGCTLTLVDTIDDLGKAARDGAGWQVCIEALEHHLAGTDPPGAIGDRWPDVHRGYVEKFGPESATIGPPPGM
ncbi:MAG TPA: SRPBCC family protein [Acidimicrobiales bacterium]|nr:SRPBCC family protein [Acidimicrobiales bacterium]